MDKKKKDEVMIYNPYAMPPMYPYMQIPGEDAMTTYMKVQEFLDKEREKAKTKEKKKPEPVKFSFLETFGLALFFGPVIGFGYLMGIKIALNYVDTLFK